MGVRGGAQGCIQPLRGVFFASTLQMVWKKNYAPKQKYARIWQVWTWHIGSVLPDPGSVSAIIYSVMQSDGNSFFGDVVLDSFSMVYSDEDSI